MAAVDRTLAVQSAMATALTKAQAVLNYESTAPAGIHSEAVTAVAAALAAAEAA